MPQWKADTIAAKITMSEFSRVAGIKTKLSQICGFWLKQLDNDMSGDQTRDPSTLAR